jgi:lysophospholipase L1-like esterase
VFGLAGYAATHHVPVAGAGQTPGYDPTASHRISASTGSVTGAHSGQPAGSAALVVAFLGDDYTAGAGGSAPAKRFSTILSARLGLAEQNFGVAATGYAKAATGGGDYAARIAAVVAAHPDVVIISGGRNDVRDLPATVAAHARQLFSALHARLPSATVIAVAPWWGDSPPRAALAPVAAAIKTAVQSAGGRYLDLPDPLRGHPEWMADAADPNDAGYAAIAAALQPAISAQLPARS